MGYEIKIEGISKADLDQFDRLAEKLEMVGDATQKAKAKMRGSASSSSPVKGPHQRLEEAWDNWNNLAPSDGVPLTAAQIKDALLNLKRAQVAVARAEGVKARPPVIKPPKKPPVLPPDDGSGKNPDDLNRALARAFRALRYGNYGEVATALGKLGGPFQSLSKLAPILFQVTAGFFALKFALSEAERTYTQTNKAIQSGGTYSQRDMLGPIGRVIGSDAAGMSGMAEALAGALQGGGIGAAYMRSKGIVDFGPYTTNKLDNLYKALDALRDLAERDHDKAVMVARSLGMGDLLNLAENVDGRTLKMYGRPFFPSPDMRQQHVMGNWELLWGNIRESFGNVVNKTMTNAFSPASDVMDATANAGTWKGLAYAGRAAWKSIPMMSAFSDIWDKLMPAERVGAGRETSDKTARDQIDATDRLTRVMKENAEMMKGGDRARGAYPAAWQKMVMEEGLKAQAAHLGVWS